MFFFRNRSLAAELMDDPTGDKRLLFKTFDQFEPINRLFCRSGYLVERLLLPHMERQKQPLTIVDIGAGGGDFALLLSRALKRRSLEATIVCMDSDPRAVEYAKARCRGEPTITVVCGSAFNLARLSTPPDYLFANHLFHHLSDDACVELLRTIHAVTRCGYVVSDLERSAFWYCLYALVAAAFFRKSYAFYDGLLSIRKSFVREELKKIVSRANLASAPRIRRLIPGRLVIDNL